MPNELASLGYFDLAAVCLAFFATMTVVGVSVGAACERAFPKRKVMAVAPAPGQVPLEMLGNVIFILVSGITFTFALRLGVIRFEAGALRSVLTFFAMNVAFQAFYYFFHRAMHDKRLLWMHRWHHQSQVTSALSAQSVHPAEALGWMIGYIGLPALVSLVVPIGFWGWAAYITFNVFGNVVGHANVELTAKQTATRGAALFANPFVYHALHHARWVGHYSFQAALMDRLFGTEYADWPELYEQIAEGKPMQSFKDRGPSFVPLGAPRK